MIIKFVWSILALHGRYVVSVLMKERNESHTIDRKSAEPAFALRCIPISSFFFFFLRDPLTHFNPSCMTHNSSFSIIE